MHDMTMQDMPMPGGWTMSMMWMPMGGQSWLDAALAFLGLWVPMMAVMMAPVVLPMLWRYRQRLAVLARRGANTQTACVAAGYLAVWSGLGLVIFPVGAAIAAAAMAYPAVAHAVPWATAAVVIIGGLVQLTPWKARRLSCCRTATAFGGSLPAGVDDAWRFGVRMGVECVACCGALTAMLLAIGMMDWRAMAAATLAITLERLAPAGDRVARIVGGLAIGTGVVLLLA